MIVALPGPFSRLNTIVKRIGKEELVRKWIELPKQFCCQGQMNNEEHTHHQSVSFFFCPEKENLLCFVRHHNGSSNQQSGDMDSGAVSKLLR
jgi:hypothetical protein